MKALGSLLVALKMTQNTNTLPSAYPWETCWGGTSDVSRELEFSPKHLPLSWSAESPSISPRRATEGPMRDVRDGGRYKEFPRTREGGQLATGKMGDIYGTGLSCYDNLNHCILRRTMRVCQG